MKAAEAFHATAGAVGARVAPPTWGGYWTYTTGAILVLFVLYLAANSQLQTWFKLFAYSSPATPNDASGGGSTGGASGATPSAASNAVTGHDATTSTPNAIVP